MSEELDDALTPGQRMAAMGRQIDLQELESGLDTEDLDPRAPRVPRELDVRRPEENIVWREASHLPDPPPRPGWAHRWIRVGFNSAGVTDNQNMAKAMREGWRPVPASEYPEVTQYLFGRSGNLDIIETGGLVLCRIEEARDKARTIHYRDKTRRQLGSINARLRESGGDDRIEFEAKTRTEVKRTAR